MTKSEKIRHAINVKIAPCLDALCHHAGFERLTLHERDAKSGILRDIFCPDHLTQEQYMRPDVVTRVDDTFKGRDRLSIEGMTPKGREFLERYFQSYTPGDDEFPLEDE